MKFGKIIAAAALAMMVACSPKETKVLVLNEGGGQHGPFTEAAMEWIRAEGEKFGFTVTEIHDTELITKDYLKDFSTILQIDYPPFNWTEEASEAFIDYIENGRGGWVGLHHASLLGEFDGFGLWEWASEFLGGIVYQNYIAATCDGTIHVEDADHPVMEGVSSSWTAQSDEFYIYDRSPRANVHVLASVDEDSYSIDTPVKMGDHPVIWTNPGVKARNVYIQMGHSPLLITDNHDFTKVFENAILWTLGKK